MKDYPGENRRISGLLGEAVEDGVFPGAVLLAAKGGQVIFFEAAGYRKLLPGKSPMQRDTIFDLASLTKPLATTLAIMKLVEGGTLGLDEPLGLVLRGEFLRDKASLTPRLLLCHSAGLADWKPFYLNLVDHPPLQRKRAVRDWIIEEPFAYGPGESVLYSDLGFMLLEWLIEEKGGQGLPEYAKENFYGPLGLESTFFNPDNQSRKYPIDRYAATEECLWRKKVIQGEVSDENAYALRGYSGHAGLFSTAEEVHVIVNMLREHYLGKRSDFFRPGTVREFFRRQEIVPGSDWALGWDTRALEGSSAGRHFSRDSVGHTGFTGTSVWMDLDKDVVAILLTNRVHPTRSNERIKTFRPVIHNLIMEELGVGSA